MNHEPFTSIENPTLAHFRHFCSLFTNLPAYKALFLRAYKAPVNCLRPSTTVEDSLQIGPFMQNKPNFRKDKNERKRFFTKGL